MKSIEKIFENINTQMSERRVAASIITATALGSGAAGGLIVLEATHALAASINAPYEVGNCLSGIRIVAPTGANFEAAVKDAKTGVVVEEKVEVKDGEGKKTFTVNSNDILNGKPAFRSQVYNPKSPDKSKEAVAVCGERPVVSFVWQDFVVTTTPIRTATVTRGPESTSTSIPSSTSRPNTATAVSSSNNTETPKNSPTPTEIPRDVIKVEVPTNGLWCLLPLALAAGIIGGLALGNRDKIVFWRKKDQKKDGNGGAPTTAVNNPQTPPTAPSVAGTTADIVIPVKIKAEGRIFTIPGGEHKVGEAIPDTDQKVNTAVTTAIAPIQAKVDDLTKKAVTQDDLKKVTDQIDQHLTAVENAVRKAVQPAATNPAANISPEYRKAIEKNARLKAQNQALRNKKP